jgi:hypothetical protein
MDTLAVRLAVPLTGSAEDFHLQGVRPAGRTKKNGRKNERILDSVRRHWESEFQEERVASMAGLRFGETGDDDF